MLYTRYHQTTHPDNVRKDGRRGKEGGEDGGKGGYPLHGPQQKELRISQIHTIVWICKMSGEEISLLAELHPRYTENSNNSPPTL